MSRSTLRRAGTLLAAAVVIGSGLPAHAAQAPAVASGSLADQVRTADLVPLKNRSIPQLRGTAREGSTMYTTKGTWSVGGLTYRYQWYTDSVRIPGATAYSFRPRAYDVGRNVHARVTASRPGYTTVTRSSANARVQRAAPPVRRTVTYSLSFRGNINVSTTGFRDQVQQTLDDSRGWRANGIAFKRVASGGSFTMVLSQASLVPSFSSGCSASYSCRVGRNVIINQNRWREATSSWRAARGSLRDYRHMVVNHETGHWLERGHASCRAAGSLAPVMAQQSKGLGGCRFNPWPLSSELYSPRFGF